MYEAMKIMQKWRRARLVKGEYCSLVEDGYLTIGVASMRMGITENEFKNLMKKWQEQGGEERGTGSACGDSKRD